MGNTLSHQTFFWLLNITYNLAAQNIYIMRNLFLFGLLLFALSSCEDDTNQYNYNEIDDELIRDYLAKNDIDATKHESGIYYFIEKTGNGTFPNSNSYIEIDYVGYTLEDLVFEKNSNFRSSLNNLIYGWKVGIPLFDIGAKGTLYIPRNLAYGNEVIIFDIELKNVW